MEKGFPYPSEPTILVSPLPKWKNKSLKDDDSLEEDKEEVMALAIILKRRPSTMQLFEASNDGNRREKA